MSGDRNCRVATRRVSARIADCSCSCANVTGRRMTSSRLGCGRLVLRLFVFRVLKEWLVVSRSEHKLWSKECSCSNVGRNDQSCILCSLGSEHPVEDKSTAGAQRSNEPKVKQGRVASRSTENGIVEDDEGRSGRADHLKYVGMTYLTPDYSARPA